MISNPAIMGRRKRELNVINEDRKRKITEPIILISGRG